MSGTCAEMSGDCSQNVRKMSRACPDNAQKMSGICPEHAEHVWKIIKQKKIQKFCRASTQELSDSKKTQTTKIMQNQKIRKTCNSQFFHMFSGWGSTPEFVCNRILANANFGGIHLASARQGINHWFCDEST